MVGVIHLAVEVETHLVVDLVADSALALQAAVDSAVMVIDHGRSGVVMSCSLGVPESLP